MHIHTYRSDGEPETVELTESETIVHEVFNSRLDEGMSTRDAVDRLKRTLGHHVEDPTFWEWLGQ